MNEHLTPISPDTPFRFACSPEVACFNECCRDLNQFLYPYDILRLKKRLGLSSSEFLQRYTTQHIGPESGLPMVTLRTTHAQRRICPFVTPKGCSVYPDRPASCRTYPLMRAISRNRATGNVSEHFMLLKEPHCLGFDASKSQTAQQWMDDQEIEIYNHFNDQMLEIIRLKNQLQPGPLDLKSRQLFYMALYDLDRFRTRLFENTLLEQIEMDPQKLEDARTDDTVLL
ncbi:MAG: YkgJ family cysteine cluster protein, partial [Deltaproteobacteria bacterium]|nr:YkgJ family cysteine cluster protein [Deltaproteobacteria bacterium]